jgi:hypothetical protein
MPCNGARTFRKTWRGGEERQLSSSTRPATRSRCASLPIWPRCSLTLAWRWITRLCGKEKPRLGCGRGCRRHTHTTIQLNNFADQNSGSTNTLDECSIFLRHLLQWPLCRFVHLCQGGLETITRPVSLSHRVNKRLVRPIRVSGCSQTIRAALSISPAPAPGKSRRPGQQRSPNLSTAD